MKIKIPATTANLGSGFDIMGVALNMYNYLEIKESNLTSLEIKNNTKGSINLDKKDNLIYKSIKRVFDEFGEKIPELDMKMEVNIPLSRGLGSSSSAISAGVFAGNILLNKNLSKNDLVKIATEIEGHPDNVAPCILGGIVLSLCEDKKVFTKKILSNLDLKFIVVVPEFELSTEKARSVLPKKIVFADAVFNYSRRAFLVQGFYDNNIEMIKLGLDDKIHEQYRANLIEGFYAVKKAGLESGAIGTVLSGAGPSILAITTKNEKEISENMVNKWSEFGIKSNANILSIDNEGILSI
ncbi:MAG: homoserine kinase [Cyanobacteriota bacterium]